MVSDKTQFSLTTFLGFQGFGARAKATNFGGAATSILDQMFQLTIPASAEHPLCSGRRHLATLAEMLREQKIIIEHARAGFAHAPHLTI
jgi:hypothetical protein